MKLETVATVAQTVQFALWLLQLLVFFESSIHPNESRCRLLAA
jgi:hypothetical protein